MLDAANNQEREANYFAICLLMPRRMLQTSVAALGRNRPLNPFVDDDVVDRLARSYQVSKTLMTWRLMELDLMACNV